jgi:DeoR/GlpR family transcriptional regulator of sugar metabolism
MTAREDRFNQILELIGMYDKVTIRDLVDHFKVTAVTIRKDLEDLEKRGDIIRTLGGALQTRSNNLELAFQIRARLHENEKRLIGKMAAGLIGTGENIIIDAGSTPLEVVHNLKGIGSLQVITPALNVALEVGAIPGVTVVMPGPGTLDNPAMSLEGHGVEESFTQFHADKYFMGVWAMDLEHGFMDPRMSRVRLKQQMMKSAHETIVLIDSSKFGRTSLFQIAPLEAVTAIVTDEGIRPEILDFLTNKGVKVYIARRGDNNMAGMTLVRNERTVNS